MVRRAETGRVVMLSVAARRLISLPLSCLVTALVSSSGFDALWEIIGAETNASRHLFVCRVNTSMQRQNISVSIQRTHHVMRRKASPTHPSLPKECQLRAWLYDLAALSGREHSHR